MLATYGVGAFDIDGTLVHHPGKPDYLSPASLSLAKPCAHTCARVRTLIELGLDVHFITGRTKEVSETTLAQLRAYVHPAIHATRLHSQEKFIGYKEMSAWKAKVLKQVGAQWFVGDHIADEEAAFLAEVPFQYATAYEQISQSAPLAVV